MCSPIRFTRPGARATRTGVAGEGRGPNACTKAAGGGGEVMRVEIFPSLLTSPGGRCDSLRARARARAQEPLCVAWRTRVTDLMDPPGPGPGDRQVVRPCR